MVKFVRAMDSRAATRITSVIAFVTLMLSFALMTRQNSYSDCLAEYNDRAAASTGARIDAAESDRRDLDRMLETVVTATDRRLAGEALREYVRNRKLTDAKRAANPQPAPPSELCH